MNEPSESLEAEARLMRWTLWQEGKRQDKGSGWRVFGAILLALVTGTVVVALMSTTMGSITNASPTLRDAPIDTTHSKPGLPFFDLVLIIQQFLWSGEDLYKMRAMLSHPRMARTQLGANSFHVSSHCCFGYSSKNQVLAVNVLFWAGVSIDGQGFVNVDSPRPLSMNPGIPSATAPGKESFGLSVFHQLHCLVSLAAFLPLFIIIIHTRTATVRYRDQN